VSRTLATTPFEGEFWTAGSTLDYRTRMIAARRALSIVVVLAWTPACHDHSQPTGTRVAAAESPSLDAPEAAASPMTTLSPPDPALPGENEADFVVHDFRFASGESLPELRIHYVTLGTPHRSAGGAVDNAVLFLHGTTGRAKSFLAEPFRRAMFDRGAPFDTSKFFVVLPDDVGHGASSKPSNALHGHFPRYGYGDMVELEHRLVVEGLGLTHLRVVAGTSMGGMHTWMWAETYPDFIDAAIPVASTPVAIRGRNLLWRRLIIEATRTDPAYADGEYARPPHGFVASLPLFNLMIDSTDHLARIAPDVKSAAELLSGWSGYGHPIPDANDTIYALDASRDYDPEPDLGRITASVLVVNFADDEIVGPSLHDAQPLFRRVRHVKTVLVPTSEATRGHSTLGLPGEWARFVADFLRDLNSETPL
jgi:homoserine O-acetyltransferase